MLMKKYHIISHQMILDVVFNDGFQDSFWVPFKMICHGTLEKLNRINSVYCFLATWIEAWPLAFQEYVFAAVF